MSKYQLCIVVSDHEAAVPELDLSQHPLFSSVVTATYEELSTQGRDLCASEGDASGDDKTLVYLLQDPAQSESERSQFVEQTLQLKVLKNNPFVVLSDRLDMNFLSQCHKAGAYDVLPCLTDTTAVTGRLTTAINFFERESKIQAQLLGAQKIAFDSMEDSAEIGRVLYFLNNTNTCTSFKELADSVFLAYRSLKIQGSVAFFHEAEGLFYSDDAKERPLEYKLIQSVWKKYHEDLEAGSNPKRFFTSGSRILAVGLESGLLIRSVSEERIGRLRDIIAGVVTGMDSRGKFLQSQEKEQQRQVALRQLVKTVGVTLSEFQTRYQANEEESLKVIDEFMLNLNAGLSELGLNEEQETYFINAAEDAMESLVSQYKNQILLKQQLEEIQSQIDHLNKVS